MRFIEIEKNYQIKPPDGGWRGLFDPLCHEWSCSSLAEKIAFLKSVPVPFIDLLREFVRCFHGERHYYILQDVPLALDKYPPELQVSKEQWLAVLAEHGASDLNFFWPGDHA